MSNDELKQLRKKYSKLMADYELLLNNCKNHVNKIEDLFDQLPNLAVQGYSSKRKVFYWNKFSSSLYGYERDEAIGKRLEELIIPDNMRKKAIANIENWITNDIPIPSGELYLRHKDGSLVPVFTQHVLIKLSNNEKVIFCLDIDLSELKEKNNLLKEAQRLAVTDGLTNIYNRLFYMQMAEHEIKQAKRDGKYLVFAMFDMDNFKKFNDLYGHRQGDKLLKTFAGILKHHCCRPNDYPFRVGGEEFLISYTAESIDKAPELAKRVFDAFSQLNIIHESNHPHKMASLSTGIAVLSPESKVDSDKLYHHADEALYKAKKNGRNQYVIAYY